MGDGFAVQKTQPSVSTIKVLKEDTNAQITQKYNKRTQIQKTQQIP